MATNEIIFSVKVQKDGNLKVIAKDAEKAASGTEKLGKETDKLAKKRTNYQKVEKGVGQAGLSSAKGFSKQAGAISGGLVPAYAILAANIFAITAAFNALKEAAQVKTLEEGFATLGNVVGRTSSLMAEELVKITDGAIAMDAALRSSAAGFSAGFNMEEMRGLAEIAKGASIALGRDLSDALDRLVRGTAKLEPEILDELGLFIRLDDAAAKYAQTLNKSVGSLTQAERRQAFLNEALAQGERKFSAVMDIETNPFDRLAAAANNLAKGLLRIVNVAVVPFINLLSSNMIILVGVFVLFANSVASMMLPALYGMGEAQRERGDDAVEAASKVEKGLIREVKATEKAARSKKTAMGKTSKFSKLQGTLGTKKEKAGDLDEMLKSLDKSSKARATFMKNNEDKITASRVKEKAEIDALIRKLRELEQARAGKGAGTAELKLQKGLAGVQDKMADNMGEISKAGALGGFGLAFKGTKEYSREMKELNKGVGKATGFFSFLPRMLGGVGKALGTAGVAARLFGVALINAIPVIGQILFFGGLLITFLGKWLGKTTAISEATGRLNTIVDTMSDKFKQLNKALKKSEARAAVFADKLDKSAEKGFQLTSEMKMLEGVVLETQEAFMGLTQELEKGGITTADKLKRRWVQFFTTWKNFWIGAGEIAGAVLDKIASWTPDFGFWDWAIGTDAEVASDMLTENFVNPLEEMIKLGNNTKQITEMFSAMNIDPKQAGAVQALADELKSQAKAMVASGDATDVNKAYAKLLNDQFVKLSDTTGKLVKGTVGAAAAFDESSKSIRDFFSKEIGKDTFLTMANDAKALSAALKDIQGNGDDAQAVLDSIKKGGGGWLRSFFGSKEEFDAAGAAEIAPLLKEMEERARKISDQQKNAALHTKNFAAQIKTAKAEMKMFKQSFEFNKFIASQNVFGKTLRTSKQLTGDIIALKRMELDLQQKIFESKERQITMEMDFKINETELLLMQHGMDKDRIALLERQLLLLQALKGERLQALEIENDITTAGIEQNSLKELFKNTNVKSMMGSGNMQSKIGGIRSIGSARDAVAGNKEAIIQAGRDAYVANMSSGDPDLGGVAGNRAHLGQTSGGLHGGKFLPGSTVVQSTKDVNAAGEQAFASAEFQAGLVDLQNAVTITDGVLQSMQENLKGFGADGELVMAFTVGMNTMSTGMIEAASNYELAEGKMGKGAAIAAAIASTIAATASILTAASNARIAAVDREIAAEQKRDGKSKSSLAKIKSLEAKKDAMARKAFETNKKMMMAQTVANTAAAVMGILAADAGKLGFLAIPMAIAVGVMGAAQLAVIAGTSYQGGGSVGAVTGPSTASVGKRRSTVDLARSQSVSGELGYLRGAKGQGGPENFERAFYGKKHRAAGGNTGYIIGEQGPELFMPDRPGTIIPNDDIDTAAGGSNVTFNINAIDAVGVEEVLTEQQGNIIGMIRAAANEYGDPFLENVDTSIYSTPFAGYRRA